MSLKSPFTSSSFTSRESPLSYGIFKILLKDIARLEEILAGQRDKLEIHCQKWANIDIYT